MFNQQETRLLQEAFAARHRALDAAWQEELPLSAAAEERIRRLLERRKRFYYPLVNTVLKRAACVAACILLLGSAATAGVYCFHARETNLRIVHGEEGAMVQLQTESLVPFEAKCPLYIPEGYSLKRDRSDEDETYLVFEGAGSDFFCYAQFHRNSATYGLGFSDYEEVTVGKGNEGIYVPNGDAGALIFTEGDFMYVINGTLPREEIFKVAESILK